MKKNHKKKLGSPRVEAIFLDLFFIFFSGISGLIYQVVWTRMLTLVFGHTIYSVSVVLSTFIAGLGWQLFMGNHHR
jgi:predicted membrane-bound spermidine synthase